MSARLGLQKEELVVGIVCLYCSAGSRSVDDVMDKETAHLTTKDYWIPRVKECRYRC